MFGHDRFGPDQDYYSTYRSLGGVGLSSADVHVSVDACCGELNRLYHGVSHFEDFPSVAEILQRIGPTEHLPPEEKSLLEEVIATHEVGHVPPQYVDAIQNLARTHRIGIVSNIWSRKTRYVAELRRVGIFHLFGAVVFSSDGSHIKPSRVLFDQAVAKLGTRRDDVIVIGDSLRCDVAGAAAANLASLWIDSVGEGMQEDAGVPCCIIGDLRELVRRK